MFKKSLLEKIDSKIYFKYQKSHGFFLIYLEIFRYVRAFTYHTHANKTLESARSYVNRAKSLITIKVRNRVGDPRIVRSVEFTEAKLQCFRSNQRTAKRSARTSRILGYDGRLFANNRVFSFARESRCRSRVARVFVGATAFPRYD